jgi:hypothetical protein
VRQPSRSTIRTFGLQHDVGSSSYRHRSCDGRSLEDRVAEDLTQDALVAALEPWPKSGAPDNPGAWLMAAAQQFDRGRGWPDDPGNCANW